MNTPSHSPVEGFDQIDNSELLQALKTKKHHTFAALAQTLSGSWLNMTEFNLLNTSAQHWLAMDKSVETIDILNAMSMGGNNAKLEKPLLSLSSLVNKAKNLQKFENTQDNTKDRVKDIF